MEESDALSHFSDDVRLIDPGIIPLKPRKEAVLIYFDETDIHLCPDKGKGYVLSVVLINAPMN